MEEILLNAIPQFQIKELPIKGAEIIASPFHEDKRGSFCESYHFIKMSTTCSIQSIQGVYPKENIAYGPISHDVDEYIYVIRGVLFAILIDHENYDNRTSLNVLPGQIVLIPSNCIHCFVSLAHNTIFDTVRTRYSLKNVHYQFDDPELHIDWPAKNMPLYTGIPILPKKSKHHTEYDFAIIGAETMIGSAFVQEITKKGHKWYEMHSLFHHHEAIRNELMTTKPKISVIVAVHLGTRPNAKWCDNHHLETLDLNFNFPLAIVGICQELNLHCTLIGTTGYYHDTEDHQTGYSEDDAPNNVSNFFYETQRKLDNVLEGTGALNRILYLRAQLLTDYTTSASSLIGKLLRYPVIYNIPSSITSLVDLTPLALEMMKNKETGIINWVCEGTISNAEILNLYHDIVDCNFSFCQKDLTIEQSLAMGNCAAKILPTRLQKLFDNHIPNAYECIKRAMIKIYQDINMPEV